MNSSSVCSFASGYAASARSSPAGRVGLHEREHVARPREGAVERLLREHDAAEQLVEVAVLLVDAAYDRLDLLACRREEEDRVAHRCLAGTGKLQALADDRAATVEARQRLG